METSDLLQCVGCQLMFYQDLNIGMNSVSTGWCLSNSTECSTVVLQGVNASSLMLHFNETLPIPGQEKVNISTQQPLAFRLVAVDENGTICSNQNTHFYRFDSKFACVAVVINVDFWIYCWLHDIHSLSRGPGIQSLAMVLSTFCKCR